MNPLFRLRSLFRKTKLDAEMRAEMTAHLDAQTQRNVMVASTSKVRAERIPSTVRSSTRS